MTALQKLFFAFILAVALPLGARAQVGITIVTTPANPQPGDVVTADFLVNNFQDILSMQFSVQWPTSSLSYLATNNYNLPGLSTSNFGVSQAGSGKVVFAWLDPSIVGISVTDCEQIFSISFTAVTSDVPDIVISNDPTVIEVIDGNGSVVAMEQNNICDGAGAIIGNVFHDLDNDCLPTLDEPGLQYWKIRFERSGSTFYRTTNPNGDYSFFGLPGDYNVSLVLPQNNLWTTCQPTQTATIVEGEQTTADFAAQSLVDCPQLTVDLGAPFLRRCFQSTYNVQYCNQGTLIAEDATVELTLDPFLGYVSSSIPSASQNGQTYTFPIGDVAVGQCGSFWVTVMVSCEAELGQAHCSEAHIFPDDICEPVNPLWDGSILDVTGSCDGDSVRFIITNNGADMAEPAPYIVIEDDMVNFEVAGIQLGAGQSYVVAVPANGATWRVELDNANADPFNGITATSVEGCGVNGSGTFSLGFVTQFPQGNESPFLDTDCQPNIGSYDPNDKTGYPNGYCAAHFIEPNTDIEYHIRFQNTGSDTAFTVVVTDTLPLPLNPATVQPGASSHPYNFELLGNGVVKFTFPDILLPDSNVNEAGSHGFVRFTVSQDANNPNGTVIGNQAGIVFDFNEAVYTNTYTHTVATEFLQAANGGGILTISGSVQTWYGEPVEGAEMTFTPVCPTYTDENGYYISPGLNGGQVTLFPKLENTDVQAGVTVLDMMVTIKHILGLQPLPTPLQIIAADANLSNSTTTFDLVEIRKLALGLDVNNSSSKNWRFLPADSVFTVPSAPFGNLPFPTTINFDTLTESLENVNFFAVKPGNVIVESMVDSSTLRPDFYFITNPLSNGQVRVSLKTNNFQLVQGFQFGVTWDEQVFDFNSIEAAALNDIWINDQHNGELQMLTTILADTLSTLPDSTTLFNLVFDAIGPIGTSTPLSLDESLLPFQVVVEDCKLAGATMSGALVAIDVILTELGDESFLVRVSPNPVRVGHPIFMALKSATAQDLDLRLFDASGRQVQYWQKEIQQGNSGFSLQPILAKGAYFLKASNKDGEFQTVKLIVY